jgi:hypothetical protein
MASFRTEHVFRAPSVAAVFDAYFDAEHQAEQDRLAQLVERTVLERDDDGDELRMVSRVVPERQYPVFMRPLVSGPLSYTETLVWRRRDNEIETEIRPSLLNQRMRIVTRYRLTARAAGEVHRVFEGDVTVELALVGGRVAKWTAAEIERSAAASASCTQAWLDRLVGERRPSQADR